MNKGLVSRSDKNISLINFCIFNNHILLKKEDT